MNHAGTGPSLDGDPEMMDICGRLGLGSAVVAPLRSRGQLLGAFHLTSGEDRGNYSPADVKLIVELAHRAALSLDTARLYDHERSIAETLQLSLLPNLPAFFPGSAWWPSTCRPAPVRASAATGSTPSRCPIRRSG